MGRRVSKILGRLAGSTCQVFAEHKQHKNETKNQRKIMKIKSDVTGTVIVERSFNAPVARVWRALTDAGEMRQWYFDLKEFKPEVGFEFEFVVEHEGNTYHHLCKVTEVIAQQKIAYNCRYQAERVDSLVTFE